MDNKFPFKSFHQYFPVYCWLAQLCVAVWYMCIKCPPGRNPCIELDCEGVVTMDTCESRVACMGGTKSQLTNEKFTALDFGVPVCTLCVCVCVYRDRRIVVVVLI